MTPQELKAIVDAVKIAKEEGFPVDALLGALQEAHTELGKWVERFAALAVQLHETRQN